MILQVTGYLILLFIAIVGGVFFQNHTGYVLFAYGHWTLETSLWCFLVFAVIVYLIFHGVFAALRYLRSSAKDFRQWRKNRSHQQAHNLTEAGLLAFYEADFPNAEKFLIAGAARSHVAVVNYLAAARAAQAQSKFSERDHYLKKAEQHAEGDEIAVQITKAELLLKHREFPEAETLLETLHRQHLRHPYILKLQAQLYESIKAWEKLSFLLERLEKYQAMDEEDLLLLRQKTHRHLLEKNATTAEELVAHWRSVPKMFKSDPEFIFLYVTHLQKFHLEVAVEDLLTQFLKRNFDARLVTVYGKLSRATLKNAEKLLANYIEHEATCITLARIAYREQDFEKMKLFSEHALRIQASSEGYALLACAQQKLQEGSAFQRTCERMIQACLE